MDPYSTRVHPKARAIVMHHFAVVLGVIVTLNLQYMPRTATLGVPLVGLNPLMPMMKFIQVTFNILYYNF